MVDVDFATAVKNLTEGIRRQHKMTHSGIVLASAAILDSGLERALKKAMRPLNKKLYKRLFESYGPLSTFNNKIVMARALGVITSEIYEELEKIRHMRNDFAHSSELLDFESEQIAPQLSALKKRNTAITNPPQVFVDCVAFIDKFLETYLARVGKPQNEGQF